MLIAAPFVESSSSPPAGAGNAIATRAYAGEPPEISVSLLTVAAVTSDPRSTAEPATVKAIWNVFAAVDTTKYGWPATRPAPPVTDEKTMRSPLDRPWLVFVN